MRWLAKAALQRGLSLLPAAERANYVLQRRVTRTLPAENDVYRRKFDRAIEHFRAFVDHADGPSPRGAVFYEFGAGWDVFIPLVFSALGVGKQIVTDVALHARVELVNHALAWLAARRAGLETRAGLALDAVALAPIDDMSDVERRFRIAYLAPRDARATGLPSQAVDFVSSTSTLEHVPPDEIGRILAECRRLLRADGLLSCRIDLRDHYSYFDRTISPYNFLRFSPRTWRLVNPPLAYQNRLRYPDYAELLERAGFEIVSENVLRPTAADLAVLRTLDLAEPFARRALEDLGVQAAVLVARPR